MPKSVPVGLCGCFPVFWSCRPQLFDTSRRTCQMPVGCLTSVPSFVFQHICQDSGLWFDLKVPHPKPWLSLQANLQVCLGENDAHERWDAWLLRVNLFFTYGKTQGFDLIWKCLIRNGFGWGAFHSWLSLQANLQVCLDENDAHERWDAWLLRVNLFFTYGKTQGFDLIWKCLIRNGFGWGAFHSWLSLQVNLQVFWMKTNHERWDAWLLCLNLFFPFWQDSGLKFELKVPHYPNRLWLRRFSFLTFARGGVLQRVVSVF